MADMTAIQMVLSRWAYAYDERDAQALGASFTDDATLTISIAGDEAGAFEGKDAIVELFENSLAGQTDQRRHVTTNYFFEDESDDAATVVSYLTLMRIENGALEALSTGYYRDQVALHDGEWMLENRHIALDVPY